MNNSGPYAALESHSSSTDVQARNPRHRVCCHHQDALHRICQDLQVRPMPRLRLNCQSPVLKLKAQVAMLQLMM